MQQVQPVIYPREDHNISRNNIDPDALKILYRLFRSGFKAYMVGGGVRDLLLGGKPKDFDIATDATPRRIKDLFRNSRIIGRRFKLVHIFFRGNKIIEVSTFRDVSDPIDPDEGLDGEGRLIIRDNKYGTEETDALRRDLTINGLFYDLSTFSIIDYVGGMRDLRAGIIRIIGDPETRIIEDPVRMVRVVRHAAKNNFSIDSASAEAILNLHELISKCAPMRVFEELKKDFTSGHCLKILRLLKEVGLLQHLLPELTDSNCPLLERNSPFSACLGHADELIRQGRTISPTVILALMAMFRAASWTSDGEVTSAFGQQSDLVEHLRDSFTALSVPRKERERIESLLIAWYQLHIQQQPGLKINTFSRRAYFQDLKALVHIIDPRTPGSGFDEPLPEETEEVSRESYDRPRQRRRTRKRKHPRHGYSDSRN